MSFGFGVGDFLEVGKLCWKVYKKCKDSPGNYAQLSSEVGALYNVIKETEELLSEQTLTSEQNVKLVTCTRGCEDLLKDLDGILIKYESLGTKSQRTFDRMGFGMKDMDSIRLRMISNVSMLDTFNNASSNIRLERKLNTLIAEVRAGKREGSVVSTRSFDTAAQDSQATWEALRRELEDIGISQEIITEKRDFIFRWICDAVAAGKLEEDRLPDKDDSATSAWETESEDSDALIENSDEDSVLGREMASTVIGTSTIEEENSRLSVQQQNLLQGSFRFAALDGDLPKIKRFLEEGWPIDFKFRDGSTPLILAAPIAEESVVKLLLEGGAAIESRNRDGDTALTRAAICGNRPVVQLLLESGAVIESKNRFGNTALICAASHGRESVVRLLIKSGAVIDSKRFQGRTALICAAANGHELVVKLLLENGCLIESRDQNGKTALLHAAKNGFRLVVDLLLDNGAVIESKDSSGQTALIRAAANGCEAVVRLLLKNGALIDSLDQRGNTALIRGTRHNCRSVVRLLLRRGAAVNKRNKAGRTALSYAEKINDRGLEEKLRSAGAHH